MRSRSSRIPDISERMRHLKKITILFLACVMLVGLAQSCQSDAPIIRGVLDVGGDEETEETDEEEASPKTPPVELSTLRVPQLTSDEKALRDKVAREVCLSNADISGALEDFTCRINEQLRWLTYPELYDRTPGRDSCWLFTHKFYKTYILNSEEEDSGDASLSKGKKWLEATCVKLASHAFVRLNYLERKAIGDPVTETELKAELEEMLTDDDWVTLKKRGDEGTTNLYGLLRVNTYHLGERCSKDLRYDYHPGVVKNQDFEIKQFLFAAHALSKPVGDFLKQFAGYESTNFRSHAFQPTEILTFFVSGEATQNESTIKTGSAVSHVLGSTVSDRTVISTVRGIIVSTTDRNTGVSAANASINGLSISQRNDYYYSYRSMGTVAAGSASVRGVSAFTGSFIEKYTKASGIAAVSIKGTRAASLVSSLNPDSQVKLTKRELTSAEKDFYFLNWSMLRGAFAGLPAEFRGELDYDHLEFDPTTLKDKVLRTIRILNPECKVKDERGRYWHSYLRSDAHYLNSDELTAPKAHFFFRNEHNIREMPDEIRDQLRVCKFSKVRYSLEDYELSDVSQVIPEDLMCAYNQIDSENKLKGYLCYREDDRQRVVDRTFGCMPAPFIREDEGSTEYFLHRGRHCMCAIPGQPESMIPFPDLRLGNPLADSDADIVGKSETLGALCKRSDPRLRPFVDIKLKGDTGELKEFSGSQTFMEYLKGTYNGEVVGRGASCIPGVDYIDLCQDSSLDHHPKIDDMRAVHCGEAPLFQ